MNRRRLFAYLLLDIAVWAIVVWLLVGDVERTRIVFWHHGKRVSWWAARQFGSLGIACEHRYNRLVGA